MSTCRTFDILALQFAELMFVWYLSTLNKFSFLHEVKVLSTLFKKENLLCAKWYTCAATGFDTCTLNDFL